MNEAADRSRKAGMEENMKAVFISNYINHHQIPFSNALYEQLGDDYHFIQTEPMEEERIAMGWGLDAATLPYVVWADREEERCRKLIEEADLVFAGWTKRRKKQLGSGFTAAFLGKADVSGERADLPRGTVESDLSEGAACKI